MPELKFSNEEEWHSIRARHIGSSECAALFGYSRWATAFTLWHAKRSGEVILTPDNDRMAAGRWLEPVIAQWAAATKGWAVEKCGVYLTHPTIEGMGASLDYYIHDPVRGPGILECKNVDWLQWKEHWTETRIPRDIAVQVQHQYACTGFAHGAVACLVGGNDLRIYPTAPDADSIAAIEMRVSEFWASIRAGKEPQPVGVPAEADFLRRLYPAVEEGEPIAANDDFELAETARLMRWAAEQRLVHERTQEACRVKLAARMGEATLLLLPGAGVRRKKHGKGVRFEVFDREGADDFWNTIKDMGA